MMSAKNGAMEDLKRVRYVAANFYSLQGLKLVPLGLLYLWWAAKEGEWIEVPGWLNDFISAFGYSLAFGLYWLIQVYYTRNYGRVLPKRGVPRTARDWLVMFAMIALVMAMVGTFVIDRVWHPPVLLFGLELAAAMLIIFWPRRAYVPHNIALAVVIAGLSLLPLVEGVSSSPALRPPVMLFLVLGLQLFVGGIFDHLMLVRSLKPARETGDD